MSNSENGTVASGAAPDAQIPEFDPNDTLNRSRELLDAVLGYAARNIPVFPLHWWTGVGCSCGRSDCTSPGKHPLTANGFKDATTDVAMIRDWWSRWPKANIGMPTGAISGIDIPDIDLAGLDAFEKVLDEHGDITAPVVQTGSGGYHVYLRHADGVSNSAGKIAPGIDVRGDGGYVVLPPSIHESGYTYKWIVPLNGHLPEWPSGLLMIAKAPKAATGEPLADTIPMGERNSTLTSFGGSWRHRGAPEAWIRAGLLAINAVACDPPLDDAEVERIARSVSRYEPRIRRSIAVPAFPLDTLPADVRSYVEAVANSINCPPEFVAVPLLTFAGAVIGNTRRIQIKPGWEEFPVLWTAVVARPGSAKSPALAKARLPLTLLQRDAKRKHETEVEKKERDGAHDVTPLEHFFTTDATPEALSKMLGGSAGVAVVHDEMAALVKGFNRYKSGGGDERQRYLSLWASQDWKVDRASQKSRSVHIEEPVVCIAGGIQPAKLAELVTDVEQSDGFTERLLFSYPMAQPGLFTKQGVESDQIAAITRVFETLRWKSTGKFADIAGSQAIRLDEEAEAIFIERNDGWTQAAFVGEGLSVGMLSKAPSHLARIALILHSLAGTPSLEVSGETMRNATRIMDYFLAHADRVLGEIDPYRIADRVLRTIKNADGWIAKTDIVRAMSNKVAGKKLDGILNELLSRGLIEHRANADTGGRSQDEYRAAEEPR